MDITSNEIENQQQQQQDKNNSIVPITHGYTHCTTITKSVHIEPQCPTH